MKPTLILIAGPNGSGKTSLTNQLLKPEWIEGCVYINPDNIANEAFGDWNSPEAVMKAAIEATRLRNECIEKKESMILETVLSSGEKVSFMEKAKSQGYFTRLFFVGTDHPSINASRIAHRVLEGGHDVPISKIVSRYSKSITNCATLSRLVDRLYVYDNSEDYAQPKLLFRAKDGKHEKVYTSVKFWASGILESLS